MNSIEIVLIDGEFSSLEGKELLLKLIDYKINFHQNKIFSAQERNSKHGIHSIERIVELKNSRQIVLEMLNKHENTVNINSSISLKLD